MMDKSLLLVLIALVLLGLSSYFYERSRFSSKEIALIVVLASIAAVGRVPFAVIPGIQPTTFMVIITGFVFGGTVGLVVGAVSALVSNLFLGQGPWTIWQMLSWGLCGLSAGFLGKMLPKAGIKTFAIFGFVWGYLFGWIMNFWYWYSFVHPLNLKSFLLVNVSSFWFDCLHAGGNVVFALVLGGDFLKILKRFQRKLKVTYGN